MSLPGAGQKVCGWWVCKHILVFSLGKAEQYQGLYSRASWYDVMDGVDILKEIEDIDKVYNTLRTMDDDVWIFQPYE